MFVPSSPPYLASGKVCKPQEWEIQGLIPFFSGQDILVSDITTRAVAQKIHICCIYRMSLQSLHNQPLQKILLLHAFLQQNDYTSSKLLKHCDHSHIGKHHSKCQTVELSCVYHHTRFERNWTITVWMETNDRGIFNKNHLRNCSLFWMFCTKPKWNKKQKTKYKNKKKQTNKNKEAWTSTSQQVNAAY